jgi:hypothetical protein
MRAIARNEKIEKHELDTFAKAYANYDENHSIHRVAWKLFKKIAGKVHCAKLYDLQKIDCVTKIYERADYTTTQIVNPLKVGENAYMIKIQCHDENDKVINLVTYHYDLANVNRSTLRDIINTLTRGILIDKTKKLICHELVVNGDPFGHQISAVIKF